MKLRSTVSILGCFVLACVAFIPAARADTWNDATKITFNKPVEIPGRVLAAGSYWFVLANSLGDRHVVRIYDASRTELEATLLTIPADRKNTTSHTQMEFVVRSRNLPEALLKWYYPSRTTGQEFVYPTRQKQHFSRDAKRYVTGETMNVS